MSSKHYTNNIYEATRAFDTKSQQWVYLEEELSDRFWICETTDETGYIICNKDNLTDLHYI